MADFVNIDPWGDLPEQLKVRIYKPGIGFVTGLLQKQIRFGVKNTWSTPFSDMVKSYAMEYALGQKVGSILAGTNTDPTGDVEINLAFKELSTQMWTGTSAMGSDLTLTYLARNGDAKKEVVEPTLKLLEFWSASVGGKATQQLGKGKFSATALKQPEALQIELGLMMVYKSVVPVDIDVIWYNETDDNGYPIRADVSIRFVGQRVYTRNDDQILFNTGKWQAPERQASK